MLSCTRKQGAAGLKASGRMQTLSQVGRIEKPQNTRPRFFLRPGLWALAALLAMLGTSLTARAQDLFEIQTYPYETVEPGHTMFEFHANYYPSGTTTSEHGTYPVNHQFHLTMEVTHGLTKYWELGGYLVSAYVPDVGPKFAGGRIRPRFRIPETWHWPFGFSVSTELGFNKHQFDPNTITLEIRPIIEKQWGKWYFSGNPDLTKSFQGVDAHRGFGMEPAVKVSYSATKLLSPGLEYYAETGPLADISNRHDQHHLLFPVLDVNSSENWEINFGVGRGFTGTSQHWVVKGILGRRFKF